MIDELLAMARAAAEADQTAGRSICRPSTALNLPGDRAQKFWDSDQTQIRSQQQRTVAEPNKDIAQAGSREKLPRSPRILRQRWIDFGEFKLRRGIQQKGSASAAAKSE